MNKKKKIAIFIIVGALIIAGIVTGLIIYFINSSDSYSPIATPIGLSEFLNTEKKAANNADYYVSVSGDDSGSGTLKKPFKTIEHAQEVVRHRIKKGDIPQEGLTVAVFGGEYRIDSLVFDKRDTTPNGKTVTYMSYNDEEVILNGGQKLSASDFMPVSDEEKARLSDDAANKVMCVDLSKYGITKEDYGKLYAIGAFNTAYKYDGDHTGPAQTEVFFNNERMNIAQYPNNDYLNIDKVLDVGECYEPSPQDYRPEWLEKQNPEGGTFTLDNDTNVRLNSWQTLDDVWMFGYFYWDWADMSTPIANYDFNKKSIETTYCSKYGFKNDALYYFYNVFEELDAEGEYYLDRDSGKLYIYPPSDINEADIQISLSTGSIIDVRNDAKNLIFDGLTVQGTRSDGVLLNGNGCTVTNCVIKNTADNGIVVTGSDNTIRSSEVSYNGKNAIVVGNKILDDDGNDIRFDALVDENNLVDNNSIHDFGKIQQTYIAGVSVHGVKNIVSHNEIYNAPHMGIFFEGNNHLIEYNDIHDVVLQSSDAGAIYGGRNVSYYGNVFRYNSIYNIGSNEFLPSGIYWDDALAGQTAYGNVLVNIPGCAFLIGGGRDNTVYNNLIINAKTAIHYDARAYDGFHKNGWYSNHVKGKDAPHWELVKSAKELNQTWGNVYPEIDAVIDDFNDTKNPDFALNPNGKVYNNIVLDSKKDLGSISKPFKEYGRLENNQVYDIEDIGFVDFANGNYKLTQNFYGFDEIPYSQIGRY